MKINRLVTHILIILIYFVFSIFLPSAKVSAKCTKEQELIGISTGRPFYCEDDSTSVCGGTFGGENSGIDSDGSVWQSGLQPPFILEQYAVETLKAVAKKRNVPTTDTVTQEHIDALLAFMFGEGGDIANRWLFNPLNSGLSADELVDGEKKANGTQSFKSFDAGVEATARTIVGKYQSRLADVLVRKDSTATEFMYALTYFNKYPGNKLWAEASVPNPGRYFTERLSLVNQVRKNYIDIASTVIGTPAKEYSAGIRNPSALRPESLRGALASTINPPSGSEALAGCETGPSSNGVVANNIAQTAVNFSWPDKWNPNSERQEANRSGPRTPRAEYAIAISQFNKGQRADGADCGVFVGTVMRASGVDPNYPGISTLAQQKYVLDHPEKYDVVKGPKLSELLPGDILVINNGSTHHTLIYVGPQGDKGYDSASASQDERSANLGKTSWNDLSIYYRARVK